MENNDDEREKRRRRPSLPTTSSSSSSTPPMKVRHVSSAAEQQSTIPSPRLLDSPDTPGRLSRKRRRSSKGQSAMRSVTCMECGSIPTLIVDETAVADTDRHSQSYETWSEKYFHVAKTHVFHCHRCPYEPCKRRQFRMIMQLNQHIERDHPGQRRVAEKKSCDDEIKTRIYDCFPLIETNTGEIILSKSKTAAAAAKRQRDRVSAAGISEESDGEEEDDGRNEDVSVVSSSTTPVNSIERTVNEVIAAGGDFSGGRVVPDARGVPPQSRRETVIVRSGIFPFAYTGPALPTIPAFNMLVATDVLVATPLTPKHFPSYFFDFGGDEIPTATASNGVSSSTPVLIDLAQSSDQDGDDNDDEPFLVFPDLNDDDDGVEPSGIAAAAGVREVEKEEEDFLVFPK